MLAFPVGSRGLHCGSFVPQKRLRSHCGKSAQLPFLSARSTMPWSMPMAPG
jgi:hypothetical protein